MTQRCWQQNCKWWKSLELRNVLSLKLSAKIGGGGSWGIGDECSGWTVARNGDIPLFSMTRYIRSRWIGSNREWELMFWTQPQNAQTIWVNKEGMISSYELSLFEPFHRDLIKHVIGNGMSGWCAQLTGSLNQKSSKIRSSGPAFQWWLLVMSIGHFIFFELC